MVSIFGIRHHGPGSARSLRAALEELGPDALLVEGPPDANDLIARAGDPAMVPPIALLAYLPDDPQKAVYYPFAAFSPEWQAVQYAVRAGIPIQFMDLPLARQLHVLDAPSDEPEELWTQDADPFHWIAEAAGYSDGERWWEHFIEQRRDSAEVFASILELMTALREEAVKYPLLEEERNRLREASMRTIIRARLAQGDRNLAVVCGAWHAPALVDYASTATADEKLLSDAVRTSGTCKVACTWVPWTYDRLARRSGYGAGVESPGWYEHLWQERAHLAERWMVKVAQHLREEDLGISPAHAIEATRMAEALAALRGRPLAGLPEMEEAVQAIFCFGDPTPMRLIHEKLIVGVRMGRIPENSPAVPLQRDLAAQQRRVRLESSPVLETLDLDLRKPLLLERSQLLHRLNLLEIPWGKIQVVRGAKGSFHEIWQVEWKPEFAVRVIEAGVWGNTVLEAAVSRVNSLAQGGGDLPALTRLVETALLADLPDCMPELMAAVERAAAAGSDIPHLMDALPPLANVLRYGSVRQTDAGMVGRVVDTLLTRIAIGLQPACSALDDEAAQAMFERLNRVQSAVGLLENPAQVETWNAALERLAGDDGVHGLVRGRACRLIFERSEASEWVAERMSQALSYGTPAAQSAAWIEGFLHGSGQALIHHPRLWKLMDAWLLSLPEATFNAVLPLLRRAFSAFPAPERRRIGEMARSGGQVAVASGDVALDPARAEQALTLVLRILGGASSEVNHG